MSPLSPAELELKLKDIVRRFEAAFSPSTIYLHGSYAHGTPGPQSE